MGKAIRKIFAALIVCAMAIAVLVPHNSAMADHASMHQSEIQHDIDMDDSSDSTENKCCQMLHCETFTRLDPANINNIVVGSEKVHSLADFLRPVSVSLLIRPPQTI